MLMITYAVSKNPELLFLASSDRLHMFGTAKYDIGEQERMDTSTNELTCSVTGLHNNISLANYYVENTI